MEIKTILGVGITLAGTALVEIGYLFIKVHVMEAELAHLKEAVRHLVN